MKKMLFSAVFILISSQTMAFFSQKNLERNYKSVHADIRENQIHVEILEKIINPSEEPQTIRFFEPIPLSAQNIQFFFEAEKKDIENLEEKPMLEELFTQAKIHEDHNFFSLGKYENTKLIKSPEFQIPPSKEIYMKLIYEFEIPDSEDFQNMNIWKKDGIPTKKSEIAVSLVSKTPVQHFFNTSGHSGLLIKENNQLAFLLEKENFTPQEDIQIFWSFQENPELQFLLHDEIYINHFIPPPPKKNITHITFLIDQSGSLLGAPWNRVQEYMHFWLEKLPEDMQVKVIFFHESIYPYHEEFQVNSKAFQQDFINYIDGKLPQGKTDLPNILTLYKDMRIPSHPDTDPCKTVPSNESTDKEACIDQDPPKQENLENQALILITDAAPKIDRDLLVDFPFSTITLDISQKGSPFLEFLSYQSGGFHQKLFRTPWKLVESEELWSKWNHWTESLYFPEENKTVNEREIIPSLIPSIAKPISPNFIGRVHSPSYMVDNANTYFLPKLWAARRTAELLQTYDLENPEILDALLAIGRTFGIKSKFFDESTTREELKKTFIDLAENNQLNTDIETIVLELKKIDRFIFHSNGRMSQGIPFYHDKNEDIWRHFNFFDQAAASNQLQIAPFSEAQKALFVSFPDLVAGNFAIAPQVEFCTIFRCISVKKGGRENYLPSDRAFFRDFDPNHWALPYLIKLIDEGTLVPELNGKIHPNRAIDRGTFVKMLVTHLWRDDPPFVFERQTFSDVKNTEFESAVNLLVQRGVIRGYSDGTFRPYQSLTRGEAAKIMLATVGYTPLQPISETALFPDATGWEKSWVNETYRRELAKGFPDGTFRPWQRLTRAEASKLIVEVKRYSE